MSSQGPCETTLTERFRYNRCECGTYPDNLGPCRTFEQGAGERCVYCDYGKDCHDAIQCHDCGGGGWLPINVCCGNGTPSGECCGSPVMGQDGCDSCQGTGIWSPPDSGCVLCDTGVAVFEGQHIKEDYHRAPNGDRIVCTKKPK